MSAASAAGSGVGSSGRSDVLSGAGRAAVWVGRSWTSSGDSCRVSSMAGPRDPGARAALASSVGVARSGGSGVVAGASWTSAAPRGSSPTRRSQGHGGRALTFFLLMGCECDQAVDTSTSRERSSTDGDRRDLIPRIRQAVSLDGPLRISGIAPRPSRAVLRCYSTVARVPLIAAIATARPKGQFLRRRGASPGGGAPEGVCAQLCPAAIVPCRASPAWRRMFLRDAKVPQATNAARSAKSLFVYRPM